MSPAGFIIEEALECFGPSFVYELINKIWQKSYIDSIQEYHAYILNVIKNISCKIDASHFLPIAIATYAHNDIVIRGAGLSLFESWDNPEYKFMLENVADSGIDWLNKYKQEVIDNLGEEL